MPLRFPLPCYCLYSNRCFNMMTFYSFRHCQSCQTVSRASRTAQDEADILIDSSSLSDEDEESLLLLVSFVHRLDPLVLRSSFRRGWKLTDEMASAEEQKSGQYQAATLSNSMPDSPRLNVHSAKGRRIFPSPCPPSSTPCSSVKAHSLTCPSALPAMRLLPVQSMSKYSLC